jgi:ligand-binding sensor domain-containing protein
MLNKIIGLLFLFVCHSYSGSSQEFSFRHYSLADGLPTNEVYHVMQDSKGYVWVSTDYGVCRYNGQEFELFTTADGLFSDITFECFEDSKGRVWMRNMSAKGLVYFENDTIHRVGFNEKTQEKTTLANLRMIEAMTEYDGSLYLDMRALMMLIPVNNISNHHLVSFNDLNAQKESYAKTNFYSIKLNHAISKWSSFRYQGFINTAIISDRYYSGAGSKPCIITKDSSYILMQDNKLLLIKDSQVLHEVKLSPKILSLSLGNDQILYVGTNNGLFSYHVNDLSVYLPPIFTDKMISSAFVDQEAGLWISTLNEGLFYISNPNLITYNKPSNNRNNHYVKSFLERDNRITKEKELLVGYYENSLDVITSNGKTHIPVQYDWRSVFNFALLNGNTFLATGSKKNIPILTNANELILTNINATKYLASYSDTLFAAGISTLYKITDNKKNVIEEINTPISSLISTENGLFVGGLRKLFCYKNYRIEELLKGKIKGEVLDVQYSKQGIIWVATKGSGLFSIHKNGEVSNFTKANGLISNYCSAICFDASGNIWVGTNNGVQIFKENEKPSNQVFTIYDGLISNNVTALIYHKNNVWVGTTSGITVVNPNKLQHTHKEIPLRVKAIFVNDTLSVPHKNMVNLNYQQNTISVHYLGLSYQNPKQKYKYRLIGLDTNWVTTTSSNIRFAQLNPGKYDFELSALQKNGEWNKKPLILSIHISPAFWQKKIFYISLSLVILDIILILLGKKLINLEATNELNESLLLARQQALNAQMNPHFVFNVLNSINSYVLENKALDASKYLTKFASLIRSTLENSFKDMIPLCDELKMIENYIALERIRFRGEFEFNVTISQEIDPDQLFIPPLILQPFLENSIWHGLAGQTSGGIISISITQPDKAIQITIEDNGVGRSIANARKNKKENPSHGMMITNKRLLLAKKRYKNDFLLLTEDLYHFDKSSAGTKVNLSLSLGHTY